VAHVKCELVTVIDNFTASLLTRLFHVAAWRCAIRGNRRAYVIARWFIDLEMMATAKLAALPIPSCR
jgi:hypothetical protein